eukprot:3272567-Rhodomonas_salina.1
MPAVYPGTRELNTPDPGIWVLGYPGTAARVTALFFGRAHLLLTVPGYPGTRVASERTIRDTKKGTASDCEWDIVRSGRIVSEPTKVQAWMGLLTHLPGYPVHVYP